MPPAADLSRRERAFTLLEISIVVFLILLLFTIGVPSLAGQLSRQRLQGAFDRFDALAVAAQKRSIAEGRPYTLVWTRDGAIQLYPAGLSAAERKKLDPAAALVPAGSSASRTEHYTLLRRAALVNNPASVWTFWPSGNCEPVAVHYEGPAGTWEAAYNPLSAKADFSTFIAR